MTGPVGRFKDMRLGAGAIAIAVALAAVSIAGCGGGMGSDEGGASYLASVARQNTTSTQAASSAECASCHAPGVTRDTDSYTSRKILPGWYNGPHGNASANPTAGAMSAACLTCHDPLNDGLKVEPYYTQTGLTTIGTVNRPVVGCETCHGNGSGHFGTGPVIYPRPDYNQCGPCHDEAPGANALHSKEAARINTSYAASIHLKSMQSPWILRSGTTNVMATCSKCHTDQGARKYTGIPSGTGTLSTAFSAEPDMAGASPVQCRTCHDAHDSKRLLFDNAPDGFGNSLSAEYVTCVSCHEARNSYHLASISTTNLGRSITDTHFDNAATSTSIEGYVINAVSASACRECHDVHYASTTIQKQWANSSHAGHIAETVNTTTGVACVVSTNAPAFQVSFTNFTTNPSRGACQRCHTSTGFRNMADNPAGYDTNKDGTPNTPNTPYAKGNQREMVYCWACHTDSAGSLRNPGIFNVMTALNTLSPYNGPSDRILNVPDLAGSNICLACHGGRATGAEIKNKAALNFAGYITGVSFANSTKGFSPHYSFDGSFLFRVNGYEFTGLDYKNPSYFQHDRIGTSSISGTGTNGPCVSCHMAGTEGHTFEAVTKIGSSVSNILTYDAVCSKCHASKSDLIARMDELNAGYTEAVAKIEQLLATRTPAIYYNGANSSNYFVTASGGTTGYTAWASADDLGAAYNFFLFKHMSGPYAHNMPYTKKLVYDTIDYLDNGSMDKTVGAALASNAAAWSFVSGAR